LRPLEVWRIARSAAIGNRALGVWWYPALLVALVAAAVLAGAANAARTAAKPSPTLLWQTYPLVQRPGSDGYRVRTFAVGVPRAHALRSQPGGMLSQTMLLLLLGSVVAAFAGVLMIRSALADFREAADSSRPRSRRRRA
jgi:hypothetical protein